MSFPVYCPRYIMIFDLNKSKRVCKREVEREGIEKTEEARIKRKQA